MARSCLSMMLLVNLSSKFQGKCLSSLGKSKNVSDATCYCNAQAKRGGGNTQNVLQMQRQEGIATLAVHLYLRSEGFVILAILAVLFNYVDITLDVDLAQDDDSQPPVADTAIEDDLSDMLDGRPAGGTEDAPADEQELPDYDGPKSGSDNGDDNSEEEEEDEEEKNETTEVLKNSLSKELGS